MTDRDDVQQFLTSARGRITPADAGLPTFSDDRRVPGLRREEVAQLAGVSVAYYTRMERGDLAGVSDSVLAALGRALRLDEAESLYLHELARTATPGVRRTKPRGEPKVTARIAQLIDAMGDVPVIAQSRRRDHVASNRLGRALFPHLFPEGKPPLNSALYMFLDPRARTFYADWEETARAAVSNIRLAAAHDPADRGLAALVGQLAVQSHEFRSWWAAQTVRIHTTGSKTIVHPIVGTMTLEYEVLEVPHAPGVGIATYLAEPGSPSADALAMLRSWAAEAATLTTTDGANR